MTKTYDKLLRAAERLAGPPGSGETTIYDKVADLGQAKIVPQSLHQILPGQPAMIKDPLSAVELLKTQFEAGHRPIQRPELQLALMNTADRKTQQ